MSATPLKVSGAGLNELAVQIEAEKTAPAAPPPTDSSGTPVPHFVKPEALAAAEELEASELATLQQHFEGAPASPDEYELVPPPPGQDPVPPEELAALRSAAHSIGVSKSEFVNLQRILERIEPASLDLRTQKMLADRMGDQLERRHGPERANQIAQFAVRAITGAKDLHPNVVAALRQEILTSRPLLELLARIGERHAKR